MFPFWKTVIAPAIRASAARRIVEIGALRGENTALILADLSDDAELHVIDPVPAFDPEEHRARFGGRYVFHGDLSLNVLPSLGAFDAALIDGDHNWYTVVNELRTLRATATEAGRPLPLCFLHDVGWPYARRDLYYDPDTIPEEFRQPYAVGGMRPGRSKLGRGGMNAQLHNATHEGGPRNGVMTAIDDFVAENDRVRLVVLPAYFGLAILADEALLEARPELAAFLDHLESRAGKDEVAELAESIRIDAAIFEQNVAAHHERVISEGIHRYLDLLKTALSGQLHIEDQARVAQLLGTDPRGADPEALRFPRSVLHALVKRLERRAVGGADVDPEAGPAFSMLAPMGRARLDHLEELLAGVWWSGVPGDLVDVGVERGGSSIFMQGWLEAYRLDGRRVWVVDDFKVDGPDDGDLNTIRDGFARHGLLSPDIRFVGGPVGEVAASVEVDQIALLRIGPDLGPAIADVLDALYPRLAPGGVVVVDASRREATARSLHDFRDRHGVTAPLEWSDRQVAWWTVPATDRVERPVARATQPAPTCDLTVVVVLHNMRREAARTLHSLSRAYQRGVDDLQYEVIVVDNGSKPEQKLTAEEVARFGPEFTLLDMGPGAPPTPIPALNEGMRRGRGRNFALMIDGAHVLTPGVLRHGMAGLATYAPAVVATVQWYVGPGQQPDAVVTGYDQEAEDRLFEEIAWPVDGYRLFEIGHFIGEVDWIDGVIESNCIFTSRSQLEQIGGFDEAFSMPGGGFANLDLYERLALAPGTNVVKVLGEGSFHQVHGGTTTNAPDPDVRKEELAGYGQHYQELRGRILRGPTTPIHHVGAWSVPTARRTRARRMTAEAFRHQVRTGVDGLPDRPAPVPDDLAAAAVESYWASLEWQRTAWLGQVVGRPAGDLLAYQELIAEVRPEWIVDLTAAGAGGRAYFMATVCDLLGHGQVVSVAARHADEAPDHPRIHRITAPPHKPAAFRAVRDVVGDDARALVVLGEQARYRPTVASFDGYCDLVPVGSYVVVEDTILNGRPVWPGFGPGPWEAVRAIIAAHPEFSVDRTRERGLVSFNRGGFLRRVR